MYCTGCSTSTFSVSSHTITAAGLHQLIVTQEIACVRVCCCNHLQSFLHLYHRLPGDGVSSATEDEEQRWRYKRSSWTQNHELVKELDRYFHFFCVYFALWLFNFFLLSLTKLQIHCRSENLLFFSLKILIMWLHTERKKWNSRKRERAERFSRVRANDCSPLHHRCVNWFHLCGKSFHHLQCF